MGRHVLRRLLSLVPVLWAMATLVWIVMFLLPGDPARMVAGKGADPAVVEQIQKEYGLDLPAWQQYVHFLGKLVRFDLHSYSERRPVSEILGEAAFPSVVLALSAIAVALLLGTAGGCAAAARRGRGLDRLVLGGSLLAVAIPVFWLGLMLRLVLAEWLHWFPISRYTQGDRPGALLFGLELLELPDPQHLVLPCLTLAGFSIGYFARVVRSSLLEVLGEDFIRTARAKGLARGQVLIRHALSHALVPLVTIAGVQLAGLIGGAIATEFIFDWPGLGKALLDGIKSRDLPLITGVVLFLTFSFVLVNLLVDLTYAWLDPRVRTS